MILIAACTVLRCIFHRRGITIVRRFVFICGVLILGRCSTLVATAYPDPSNADDCKNISPEDSFFKQSMYCGALMYSTETVYLMLMGLTWSYYSVTPFEKLIWLPIVTNIFLLVASRVHYLNDVLVAIYLTIIIWFIYHLITTEPPMRKRLPVISWLETDIILWEEAHPKEALLEPQFRYFAHDDEIFLD